MLNVSEFFGDIDIYLFDQILKNRFTPTTKILDSGCGGGRNLVYFLRENFQIFAVDREPEAIEYVRYLAKTLAPEVSAGNFQVSTIEKMPYADETFDWVLSNAVLHFAENEAQFNAMLSEMWRVLKPSGILFARLASIIGIEDKIEHIAECRYLLPDGSERFLVDERMLIEATENLGGIFIEPIKTTNVQNLRSMTTWVIGKSGF